MQRAPARPLSPHLQIWKWGPHMLVSILHRATGVGMATVGVGLFVWWLAALAAGPDAYGTFYRWVVDAGDAGGLAVVANWVARAVAVGMTWAFFQHLANGIRHLFLDMGANFELRGNKQSALAAVLFAPAATAVLWGYIVWKGLAA